MSDIDQQTVHQAAIARVRDALPELFEKKHKLILPSLEGESDGCELLYKSYMRINLSLEVMRLYGETADTPITVSIARTLENMVVSYINKRIHGIEATPKHLPPE